MAPKAAPAAPAAAAAPAGKGKKPAPVNGHAEPREAREPRAGGERSTFVQVSGKPDKEAHEKETKAIDDEILRLQGKTNDLRKKLAGGDAKDSPANTRREELRAQLNALRSEQAASKTSRQSVLNQIKALNDSIANKNAALKSSRDKSKFRSVADVDAEIKRLERQVESGQMRLVDEKKTLTEISNLRRTRKTVEGFGGQDDAIQADKKQIDELRKQLDAPEAKAASDKYTALKDELDKLNADNDVQRSGRQKLHDERDALKTELDALFEKKRNARNAFRDASDKYYQKVQEEKRKRQERERSERLAWQEGKRKEENERLLETAKQPAYEREIEDCRNLLAFFSKGAGADGSAAASSAAAPVGAASGLPQLNLRKVEADNGPALGVALKKKGEEQEDFYVGKGGKRKGGRGAASSATCPAGGATPAAPAGKQSFNIPLPYLSALLTLGISAPTSQADAPQIVEALTEKRKRYEEHQDAETKKRIADAEKRIAANDAKSREPEVVEPAAAPAAADAATADKPALATRASAEADIPLAADAAPKLANGGEAVVSSSNGVAEPVSESELSAATESTA